MNLRLRLSRIGASNYGGSKMCTCVPAWFVMAMKEKPDADRLESGEMLAKVEPRCPTCGGVADGVNVWVVREGR